MSLLARYIFREVFLSSLIGTALFTFVIFLQTVEPVMEQLIRPRASTREVLYLFALQVPQALSFTIPMGVLVGVLVGLGRMSTDSELTAMRAAGVSGRRVAGPVSWIVLAGILACGITSLWLDPLAQREFQRIGEDLRISEATARIQPRVFNESFPNHVLWVQDVIPGDQVVWKGVFVADMRAPEERGSAGSGDAAIDGPRITVAEEALILAIPEQERLQMYLPHMTTYEQSFNAEKYVLVEQRESNQVLQVEPTAFAGRRRPFSLLSTPELLERTRSGDERLEASVNLHRRLTLPLACLVLPLTGIPLAISTKRASRSVGVLLSVVLVFAYYVLWLGGTGLASEGVVPPWLGIWFANVFFAAAGAYLFANLDAPNRRDWTALVVDGAQRLWERIRTGENANESDETASGASSRKTSRGTRLPLFPLVDRYVLRLFVFYLFVFLLAFLAIWFIFSFFELLNDMLARQKLGQFIPYIYYLTPFLVYETAPLAVLVATLVSFGILAKHSELTAFKATGVSLYRLAAPVLLCSGLLSASLFALDSTYLPEFNRKQDAIRNEIKGKPPTTFWRPDRQWTFGRGARIFYHRQFNRDSRVLVGVNVYDFDPATFQMVRHISAERAVWDDVASVWVFQQGWVRHLDGAQVTHFDTFDKSAIAGISEDYAYFVKEIREHQQMNFGELQRYVLEMAQSGFDTLRLQIQLERKLAFPLFALVMGVLAVPFALLTGHQGALKGVALAIGIAAAYYSLNALSAQLGRAGQLSPAMAAWAPSAIFGLSGMYLFLRVRT